MNKIKKILLILISIFALVSFWVLADSYDYFNSDYKDLTSAQEKIFRWKDGDNEKSLQARYRTHFTNKEFTFPRQKVFKVLIFNNKSILGLFTAQTLKENEINNFVKFCNDSTNFHWGESTWQASECEYYFKLYNDKNNIIGKMYFCLDKCGMTSSRPFCPAMKFGGLTDKGQELIEKFIYDNTKWD